MKLQKSTWFLLFFAIILGGWVYFYEIRLEAQKVVLEKQAKKIFNFDPDKIHKITIVQSSRCETSVCSKDATAKSGYPQFLELIKSSNDSTSWLMQQPESFPVNEGVMAFLINLIEQGIKERKLLITPDQLFQYGLEQPVASITIQLQNQQTYQILLGKEAINSEVIYAQINPTASNKSTTEVLLVSKNWHYAVIRDLAEWKD